MSEIEVLKNRKQRKAMEKSAEKADKQFKKMRQDIAETTKRTLGPVQEQYERDIASGKTDYSLYNMLLEIVSFKDSATSLESCRRVYESSYPYMRRMNLRIKALIATLEKYELSPEDTAYLTELKESKDLDPFKMATEVLQESQNRARQRSKLGIKFYNS